VQLNKIAFCLYKRDSDVTVHGFYIHHRYLHFHCLRQFFLFCRDQEIYLGSTVMQLVTISSQNVVVTNQFTYTDILEILTRVTCSVQQSKTKWWWFFLINYLQVCQNTLPLKQNNYILIHDDGRLSSNAKQIQPAATKRLSTESCHINNDML
jgi:hypothetical protein